MILNAGNKIVYPSQGPCLIGPVVKKMIDDRAVMFYQLTILNESGGELFVPVDKVDSVGIRLLLKKSEIPKLLDQLKQPAKPEDTWRERTITNLKLFATGSAFDLAEIVESLTELSETKALSFAESKRLDQAKRLLVSEISEVIGATKEDAEQMVDAALAARMTGVKASPLARGNRAPVFDPKRGSAEVLGQTDKKAQQAAAQGS
jgi:RNA polymerase-interacting CarD/CdnL/TRCF family regulator